MKKKVFLIVLIVGIVLAVLGIVVRNIVKDNFSSTVAGSSQKVTQFNEVLIIQIDPTLGRYLTDSSGRALYIYGGDSTGKSNCTGSCLYNWPAYGVAGSVSRPTQLPNGVSVMMRPDDHQRQYTYDGMPLYYYLGDSSGQVTGNNVDNFQVARPLVKTDSSSAHTAF